MIKKLVLAIAAGLAGTTIALADHNSLWGEGTALDPTGIHDARVDSIDSAGDEPFGYSDDDAVGKPFDLLAAMRQERPDTIDIDQGQFSAATQDGMGGTASGAGGGGAGGAGAGGAGGAR